jgi:hypothetical protein
MRVRLKDMMEFTSLPVALDKDKGIERDEFFKTGGHYRAGMNQDTSRVDVAEKVRFKQFVKDSHHNMVHNHHKTVLVSPHSSYQKMYRDNIS